MFKYINLKYLIVLFVSLLTTSTVLASNFLNYNSGFVADDDYVIDGDVKINNNFIESWFETGKGMHLRFSKLTSATNNKVHFGNSEGTLKVYGNIFTDPALMSLNSTDGLSTPLGLLFGNIGLKSINQAPFTSSSQLVNSSGDISFINTSGGFKWNTTTPTTLTTSSFKVPSVLANGAGLTNLKWRDDLGTLLGADPIPNDILDGDDFPLTPKYSAGPSSSLSLTQSGADKILSLNQTDIAFNYHTHSWGDIVGQKPTVLKPGSAGVSMDASTHNNNLPDDEFVEAICNEGNAICKIGSSDKIANCGAGDCDTPLLVYCCPINQSDFPW